MKSLLILYIVLVLPVFVSAGGKEKAIVKSYADKLLVFEKKGREMDQLRVDVSNNASCFEKMYKYQPLTDKLNNSIINSKDLPSDVGTYFGAAAFKLRFCVSCSSSALNYCEDAHNDILKGMSLGMR